MSEIYEALKKAERERGSQAPRTAPSEQAAGQESTPAGKPPLLLRNADAVAPADPALEERLSAANKLPDNVVGEFQVLSTNVARLAAQQNIRIFQIASASESEGKSFVSLNLGVSLARAGSKVLLIDADLRAPSLHHPFAIKPLRGLMDLLLEKAQLDACLYDTGEPGLTLLPAGGHTTSASELFVGNRIGQVLAAAKTASPQGYILIDCPSVLGVPETQIIAHSVDAVLFVVAANRTSRSALSRALGIIKEVCPVSGFVMNRFEPFYTRRSDYGYYGYYGYGYGYGYHHKQKNGRRATV